MIRILIDTDNAAFDDDPIEEIANILQRLVNNMKPGYINMLALDTGVKLFDTNGNAVGTAVVA